MPVLSVDLQRINEDRFDGTSAGAILSFLISGLFRPDDFSNREQEKESIHGKDQDRPD